MKVVAVIPAYNEAHHIGAVVRKTKKYVSAVVVVDDGSMDNTKQKAEEAGAYVLSHLINLGKGAALRTGIDYAITTLHADTLVLLDADGQHHPEDIPLLLEGLAKAPIVFGCRKYTKTMPFIFRMGNFFLNHFMQWLFGIAVPDTQSGFRAFKAEIYPKILWEANDYSVESEMIAQVGKHHIPYVVVPIKTIYHDRYKGTTIVDGIKIFVKMLLWRVR